MSAPQWMPFYVGDYLADTGHLTAVEHGAYLMLICHYWQHDGLPNDDVRLARICRMSGDEWATVSVSVRDLFGPNWTHKRIDFELNKARELIEKRSKAGKASAEQRANKCSSDVATHVQTSHSDSEKKDIKFKGRENLNGVAPQAPVADLIAAASRKGGDKSNYLWLKQSDTRVPQMREWWRSNYGTDPPLTYRNGRPGYHVPWAAVNGH